MATRRVLVQEAAPSPHAQWLSRVCLFTFMMLRPGKLDSQFTVSARILFWPHCPTFIFHYVRKWPALLGHVEYNMASLVSVNVSAPNRTVVLWSGVSLQPSDRFADLFVDPFNTVCSTLISTTYNCFFIIQFSEFCIWLLIAFIIMKNEEWPPSLMLLLKLPDDKLNQICIALCFLLQGARLSERSKYCSVL